MNRYGRFGEICRIHVSHGGAAYQGWWAGRTGILSLCDLCGESPLALSRHRRLALDRRVDDGQVQERRQEAETDGGLPDRRTPWLRR